MAAVLDYPSDNRVNALLQCMQGRARRASADRYQFSFGFDGLAPGPSAWDTLSLVHAEMEMALKHLRRAYEAVTKWVHPAARGTQRSSFPS